MKLKIKAPILRIGPFFIITFLALIACIVVVLRPGWPYNHDGNAVFIRARIFTDLFNRYNEFFPAWTAYGNYGLGSPMPFFYHRLYYYLIVFIDFFCSDIILSVKFSVFLLLFCGGTAVYLTVKEIFRRRIYAITAGGLFIFSTYIYTQWLVRGAFSEFLASMVFAWLLYILAKLSGRFSYLYFSVLGLLFALLLYAHSIIFVFTFFLFALFLIFHLQDWLRNPAKPFITAIPFILLGLPYIIPFERLKGLFNMKYPVIEFQVKNDIIEIYRYFFDNHYNIGETWQAYSVEIGRFFVLPLIIMFIMVIVKKKRLFIPGTVVKSKEKFIPFVFVSFFFYLYLLTTLALPLYNSLDIFLYIQFPWRLLCIITPLAIILFIYYAKAFTGIFFRNKGERILKTGLAAVLLVQVFWVGGNFEFFRYGHFPRQELLDNMSEKNLDNFVRWDEYQPLNYKRKAVSSILENHGMALASVSDPSLLSSVHEFGAVNLSLGWGTNGTLVFNQIYSPFIKIKYSSNITASRGEYLETVFGKSDNNPAFIEISKAGLADLIRWSLTGNENIERGRHE